MSDRLGDSTSEAVLARIDSLHALMSELEGILQSVILNDSTIIDALAQMLGTLQAMQMRSDRKLDEIDRDLTNLRAEVMRLDASLSAQRIPDSTDPFVTENPEIGLLEHLLPYLPNPIAIDVGANVGRVTSRLADMGYEVFAFEPFSPSFAVLSERMAGRGGIHVYPYAIGASDGSADLLLATDGSTDRSWDTSLFHSLIRHPMLTELTFESQQPVTVRSLASLFRDQTVPNDAAVLKVDTEGGDLEVIRGAAVMRFSVVIMEFWDGEHPFGLAGHGDLARLVTEMRGLGYRWHIVLFRLDETGTLGFYCNSLKSVPKSWGNVVFFRDHALLAQSVAWCSQNVRPAVHPKLASTQSD